ncbi:hypothetical protein IMW63_03040 [Ehrlichia ruminantium]|uniref:hypothetical protein n=1 Tax=Ehrlichia ruminantium TaxID=779 RepID=UPI001FB547B5|nr:hypothetical protein [Ehrlichia ruminantium]UOD98441.1 hypothetical protein IMW63_03040 [Ehrlichia ruminantium]
MLFKYNPQNTKKLHDEALECINKIRKLWVFDFLCIGNTASDGILDIILDDNKTSSLIRPSLGEYLFYMKGSLSAKVISENLPLVEMEKAVLSPSARIFLTNHKLGPVMDLGIYILIHHSNLRLLTKENLYPANNLDKIGKVVLCKPLSIGNGIHKVHMYFNELEALKEFGGLENARFTTVRPDSPLHTHTSKKKKSLFTKRSDTCYTLLCEESYTDPNNTETDSTVKAISYNKEEGAVGGNIPQYQLSNAEALGHGLAFFHDLASNFETLCRKYH